MIAAGTDKGLVVFVGCGHAGVVNAAKHALELGGGAPLYTVIGGFHFADDEGDKLEQTLDDLKSLGPTLLMPGHCAVLRTKFKMDLELAGFFVPCFSGMGYSLRSDPLML